MEESKSTLTKRLGIAATVVSLLGGSIALWDRVGSDEEVLPKLSGRWHITNTVEHSNGGKYDREVYGYSVGVNENSSHELSGEGEQDLYVYASGTAHTNLSRWPFTATSGTNEAEGITLHFRIDGNRTFTGTMYLTADEHDPKHLMGTFEYTADGTRGTSEVRINAH